MVENMEVKNSENKQGIEITPKNALRLRSGAWSWLESWRDGHVLPTGVSSVVDNAIVTLWPELEAEVRQTLALRPDEPIPVTRRLAMARMVAKCIFCELIERQVLIEGVLVEKDGETCLMSALASGHYLAYANSMRLDAAFLEAGKARPGKREHAEIVMRRIRAYVESTSEASDDQE